MANTSGSPGLNFIDIVKALENSPKGRLKYDTGWDETPNAVTALITTVQEAEIDGPNRNILERCYRVHHLKERISLSPKTSPTSLTSSSAVASGRGRHSLPGNIPMTVIEGSPPCFPSLHSNNSRNMRKIANEFNDSCSGKPSHLSHHPGLSVDNNSARPEPRIEIHYVPGEIIPSKMEQRRMQVAYNNIANARRRLLTPPSLSSHRKKSVDGSPNLKPSPTLSSSTQTQTHSSTTSDATLTPVRKPNVFGKSKKFGITDVLVDEEKLEEDLILESRLSPYSYIESCMTRYQEEEDRKVREAAMKKFQQFKLVEMEHEKLAQEQKKAAEKAHRDREEAIKQQFAELDRLNLDAIEIDKKSRSEHEQLLLKERKAAAAAAEQLRVHRKAALEAAKEQERLRIEKVNAEQKRLEQAAILENELLQKQKIAEEKRLADEAETKRKQEAEKKLQVVPELNGLILKDDLTKYAQTTELLKSFEDPVVGIDGKDPATKAFYIGAVKCINTPLNALADTTEIEILAKVNHFTKLLSGEAVSGGGSLSTLFSCKSIPNGDTFVMKTLAFRFVKKSEADVTRGTSTVQPLATVGVHLCKLFPVWAALVQGNIYKLCPFLVPFSYPQGDKSIQQYASELGHDLSGTEAAIQQTFLERLKGYCTLYALMVLKFYADGPFDIGEATDFFTLGGAWKILARTIKLEPQVDVTATIIHTLLDILDDRLYAVYRSQFTKLIRLLVTTYLPRIRQITPPAKAGSLSRLQIYLEKKFSM